MGGCDSPTSRGANTGLGSVGCAAKNLSRRIIFSNKSQYLYMAERSHSGLVHRLGKAAYLKGYREFESRPLRHVWEKVYPVRTPPTPVGGRNGDSRWECNAPIDQSRSTRSNGVYPELVEGQVYPKGYHRLESCTFRFGRSTMMEDMY